MLSRSGTVKYFFPGASLDREEDLGSVATDSSVTDEFRTPRSPHDHLLLPIGSMIAHFGFITFLMTARCLALC